MLQILPFKLHSYSSQPDCLHLMVNQFDDIQRIKTLSKYKCITEVDVHVGLSTVPSRDVKGWEKQWKPSLSELLDIHPSIVCVHHNFGCDISQDIVDSVNERFYLIDSSNDKWYIWSR